MTNEQKQEFTRRVSQANRSEMIVILYDIFLVYVRDALDAGEQTQLRHAGISRAKDTIRELMSSINSESPLASNYRSLYTFILHQLAKADASGDREILRQLQMMVTSLRNTYKKVSDMDKSPAVMGNVETVYAGLTYGRGQINENLQNADNRGFLV
ncbi:MAG: flagellar protein FliS [Lachnospiraceae bacterium]|jgi:flagellar protein FliS|nr:flagellar protein FliS [Lachnospiraceae bacterium]